MKKMLALFLSLLMLFSCTASLAEAIEITYEGTWVQFEDGFELYLPSEWVQYEVPQENVAKGIFYAAGSADATKICMIGWSAMEAALTIDELQARMVATYPTAAVQNFGNADLVCYTDEANNMLVALALDATEPGFYAFMFSPCDDVVFTDLASQIVTTIRNSAE